MIECVWENGQKFKFRHVTLEAIVVRQNKILLVKRSSSSLREANKYCLPGGFLNMDETPTEGVMRELLEETGYKATIARIFKITGNPTRANTITQDVDFIFIVEVEKNPVAKPDNEVTVVEWFDLNNLPEPTNFAFDHYDDIQLYLDHQTQKFPLPVLDL